MDNCNRLILRTTHDEYQFESVAISKEHSNITLVSNTDRFPIQAVHYLGYICGP